MKNSFRPPQRKAHCDHAAFRDLIFLVLPRPIDPYSVPRLRYFVLGGPPRRPQYAVCLLTRRIALDATPKGDASWRMRATNSRHELFRWRLPLWRPSAGWLLASFGGKAGKHSRI